MKTILILCTLIFSAPSFAIQQGFTCTDSNGHTRPCNFEQVIPDDGQPR